MHEAFKIQHLFKKRSHLLIVISILAFFVTGLIYALNGPIFNPSGDEPHYLVISQTLLKYHSLNVMADYNNGDYQSFYFHYKLGPQVATNTRNQILPLHSLGGPILWLIPFFLLGRLGAVWFISGLSVLLVWNMYRFLLVMGIREKTAFIVSLIYTLASPIYLYAHLTFIEPIGAFICIYVVRKIVEKDTRILALVFSSIWLGILLWVHVRFALLEMPLFFALLYRVYQAYKMTHLKHYLAYLLPITIITIIFEIYTYVFWGTLNPSANQFSGGSTLFEVWPYQGLFGILFDQNYGLLICFPLCIFLLAGIILALQKRYRWHNIFILILTLPYILAFTTFRHWGGGWSPPARFIMVLLPVLAFYIAYVLDRANNRFTILVTAFSFCWGVFYNFVSLLPPNNGFGGYGRSNLTLSFLYIDGHHLTNILPDVSSFNPIKVGVWVIFYIALSILFVRMAKTTRPQEIPISESVEPIHI